MHLPLAPIRLCGADMGHPACVSAQSSYWTNVVAQINAQAPGTVDGVHLQAYAGGSENNPCVGWNFGTVPVWPGLWDQNDTPSQVQSIMSGWHSQCGINGGFMLAV